jgi:hypothetical protein
MAPYLTKQFAAASSLVAFCGLFPTSHASTFLGTQVVGFKDALMDLEQELADSVSSTRVAEVKEELQRIYPALPKNSDGNLEHQTVRYVLHRIFSHRWGWYIKGLEPNGDVWQASASQEKLKDWVPSYLLGRLEERLGGRGVSLNDLSALGAAIEDVAHQEATRRLADIYRMRKLPIDAKVHRGRMQEALTTYLAMFLDNGNLSSSSTPGEVAEYTMTFAAEYTGWRQVQAWMHSLVGQEMLHVANDSEVDFALAAGIAAKIGTTFSSFNDHECKDLRTTLVGMRAPGNKAGRVTLPEFYRMGLHSHWGFNEKSDYLRALGALDETDPKQPMVIIPNYIGSRPNCLEASSLYAVCCRSGCEELLMELEEKIGKPTAAPARIIELVASLKTDTVTVPRQLAPELESRLKSIAEVHGGEVNLHGRLFAQWMHHAYPNECPYPHEAGTTNPVRHKCGHHPRPAETTARPEKRYVKETDATWLRTHLWKNSKRF